MPCIKKFMETQPGYFSGAYMYVPLQVKGLKQQPNYTSTWDAGSNLCESQKRVLHRCQPSQRTEGYIPELMQHSRIWLEKRNN